MRSNGLSQERIYSLTQSKKSMVTLPCGTACLQVNQCQSSQWCSPPVSLSLSVYVSPSLSRSFSLLPFSGIFLLDGSNHCRLYTLSNSSKGKTKQHVSQIPGKPNTKTHFFPYLPQLSQCLFLKPSVEQTNIKCDVMTWVTSSIKHRSWMWGRG